MTHPRQLIRHAIAAAIGASTSRVRPTRDNELPCRLVYVVEEASDVLTVRGTVKRSTTIIIEVRAKADPGFDDALDAEAEQIEGQLGADPKFGGVALNSWLAATAILLDHEPETPQAVMRLTYTVTYST